MPALIAALSDEDQFLRRIAANALGNIGDPAAVPALTAALSDGDDKVRQNVIDALGKLRGCTTGTADLTQKVIII